MSIDNMDDMSAAFNQVISDMNKETTVENSARNSAAEQSLESAFNNTVNGWERNAYGDNLEDDSDIEDSEETQEGGSISDEDEAVQKSQLGDEAKSQPETRIPAENASGHDNQQLLSQLLQEKDNQLQLLYSRLNDLSTQYKTLKEETSKKVETKEAVPAEVQELYETYPELATAIDKIVESKVNVTKKTIEETLTPQTAAMQQQLQEMAQQQYISKIMQVHPDLPQIMQSNALNKWIATLSDPVQRAGAEWITRYGTVDNVVQLISQYKSSQQGFSTPAQSVNNRSTVTPTTSTADDDLVQKIVNAISVPSERQAPTPTRKRREYATTTEAFKALANEYERKNYRY